MGHLLSNLATSRLLEESPEPGLGGFAGAAAVPGHRNGGLEVDGQGERGDLGMGGDEGGDAAGHRGDQVLSRRARRGRRVRSRPGARRGAWLSTIQIAFSR